MNKLEKLLTQLETNISKFNKTNQKISKSNVGWHIEHTLLVLTRITDSLANSNPEDYKWKFQFIRIAVFTMKKIPRGKAKSPEVVQPKGNYNIESLTKHLSNTKARIEELQTMDKNKYFDHPVFGHLKLKQTINFLEIHTKHHLEIINDIQK